MRSLEWYQPERYRLLVDVNQTGVCVKRYCLDAGDYINAVLQTHAASIRFSGTVSPLELYQRLHGRKDQAFVRAESPFNAAICGIGYHRCAHLLPAKKSKSGVMGGLIQCFRRPPVATWWVFPSYAYLDAFSQQHRPLNYVHFTTKGADIDALDEAATV